MSSIAEIVAGWIANAGVRTPEADELVSWLAERRSFGQAFDECPRADWLVVVGGIDGQPEHTRKLASLALSRLGQAQLLPDAVSAAKRQRAIQPSSGGADFEADPSIARGGARRAPASEIRAGFVSPALHEALAGAVARVRARAGVGADRLCLAPAVEAAVEALASEGGLFDVEAEQAMNGAIESYARAMHAVAVRDAYACVVSAENEARRAPVSVGGPMQAPLASLSLARALHHAADGWAWGEMCTPAELASVVRDGLFTAALFEDQSAAEALADSLDAAATMRRTARLVAWLPDARRCVHRPRESGPILRMDSRERLAMMQEVLLQMRSASVALGGEKIVEAIDAGISTLSSAGRVDVGVLLSIFATIHERCADLARQRLVEVGADREIIANLLSQIEAVSDRIAGMQRANVKVKNRAS